MEEVFSKLETKQARKLFDIREDGSPFRQNDSIFFFNWVSHKNQIQSIRTWDTNAIGYSKCLSTREEEKVHYFAIDQDSTFEKYKDFHTLHSLLQELRKTSR